MSVRPRPPAPGSRAASDEGGAGDTRRDDSTGGLSHRIAQLGHAGEWIVPHGSCRPLRRALPRWLPPPDTMRPFWSPLSALLVPDPPELATPGLLRLLLRTGKPADLVYAGDRMWPAIAHGEHVIVDPLGEGASELLGAIVVAAPSGIPDLFRVEREEERLVIVVGDSDPQEPLALGREELLGMARRPRSRPGPARRAARRLWLDLREASLGRHDHGSDPASTVRSKYDLQAPFYVRGGGTEMAEPLLDWFTGRVPAGGRVLVAGSGAGRECFALAARGWQVTGVDFSEPMVEAAKQEALRRGLGVDFELADLRSYDRPGDTLAAVYFTYEVYSFLPAQEERLALLAKMARWLAPGGVIFLSARWFEGFYAPAILTLQRAVRLSDRQARWGQSHTRWLALDGAVHRSFIHIFTKLAVEREARQAGLEPTGWLGSHCLLVPSLPDFPLGS